MNTLNTQELSLEHLAGVFANAKASEIDAIANRRAIGTAITQLLAAPFDTYEGSTTGSTPSHKVSIQYSVTRKVDDVDELRAKLPPPIFDRLIRFAPSVNLEELRYLERNEPDFYQVVCEHITTKPSAPSIKVDSV